MEHNYVVPTKALKDASQIPAWEKSSAYYNITGFLQTVNVAVKGRMCSDPHPKSKNVEATVKMLDTLEQWIDEIPPVNQPQRFGNTAFRTWFTRLEERAEALLQQLLPISKREAGIELRNYLIDSFGNKTRIDYGSGHELTFAAFLCCLAMLEVYVESDMVAVGLTVFKRYLEVVRKLQCTYMLEPAGSHGVWGLDDYQFIPYYWGSSQLMGSSFKPSQIPDRAIADTYGEDYLFFSCIRFIYKMKTGPFFEHSRYLFDISSVPEWRKVNSGLLKMYQAEVLLKHPVVQHFLFGSMLTLKQHGSAADAASAAAPPAPLRTESPPPAEDPFKPTRAAPGVPIAGPVAPGFDPRKHRGTNGPARGCLRRPQPANPAESQPSDAGSA
eukprot:m.228473 g.228473  ORF g.228473 m.228473 type:complete len:384 (-) comp22386_c0_seq15:751-1902(-)